MSAAPDVRSIMDNQFKNVKTHARLLSKSMWYEWRMKLLDGLKEGLLRVGEGMAADAEILAEQEALIKPVLPALIAEHERLEKECQLLQAQADELASCDQEELKEAREKLKSTEEDIEAKTKMVEELQRQLQEKEECIANATERKQECLLEIKEAEKVREECRGWTAAEIAALKGALPLPPSPPSTPLTNPLPAQVATLELTTGWAITTASASTLTLTYRQTLHLFFHPSSFLSPTTTTAPSPIRLTYLPDPDPLPTQTRFFLQLIRAHLQSLHQPSTPVAALLRFVQNSWDEASRIAEEIRLLNLGFVTEVRIRSDEVLAVAAWVLLRGSRTKLEVRFEVEVGPGGGDGLEVRVGAGARVVYGEGVQEGKMAKMGEFLRGRIAGGGEEGGGGWARAVRELEGRVGRRGGR